MFLNFECFPALTPATDKITDIGGGKYKATKLESPPPYSSIKSILNISDGSDGDNSGNVGWGSSNAIQTLMDFSRENIISIESVDGGVTTTLAPPSPSAETAESAVMTTATTATSMTVTTEAITKS